MIDPQEMTSDSKIDKKLLLSFEIEQKTEVLRYLDDKFFSYKILSELQEDETITWELDTTFIIAYRDYGRRYDSSDNELEAIKDFEMEMSMSLNCHVEFEY